MADKWYHGSTFGALMGVGVTLAGMAIGFLFAEASYEPEKPAVVRQEPQKYIKQVHDPVNDVEFTLICKRDREVEYCANNGSEISDFFESYVERYAYTKNQLDECLDQK
jgi:hypothetical protein